MGSPALRDELKRLKAKTDQQVEPSVEPESDSAPTRAVSLSVALDEETSGCVSKPCARSPLAVSCTNGSWSSSPRTLSQASRAPSRLDVAASRTDSGGSTWGRRLREADVRSLHEQLEAERARSAQLASELKKTQVHMQKLQSQLDLQRTRDELLSLDPGQDQIRQGHVCRSICALFGRHERA
mmetsp:Transcript_46516/g.86971  ORF Transcript_46516/g.86971 Transcript_46516/m.86971 type:complete len:183 (+) Transcript_46516:131-679(+)